MTVRTATLYCPQCTAHPTSQGDLVEHLAAHGLTRAAAEKRAKDVLHDVGLEVKEEVDAALAEPRMAKAAATVKPTPAPKPAVEPAVSTLILRLRGAVEPLTLTVARSAENLAKYVSGRVQRAEALELVATDGHRYLIPWQVIVYLEITEAAA